MRKVVVLTVFIIGGFGALGAHAQDPSGFYLGGSVGIEVAITTGLRFRAEYEAVDVSEGDFQIVSAGAVYKF